MNLPSDTLARLRRILVDLSSRPLDRGLVADVGPQVARLVGADYFAFCRLGPMGILVANSDPEYLQRYAEVSRQDYLKNDMVTHAREYVLSRHPCDRVATEHAEFNHTCQSLRPIADMVYSPVTSHSLTRGFWAFARAGRGVVPYTEDELRLFRFVMAFFQDAFERSQLLAPEADDVAQLNFFGQVVAAGPGFAEAYRRLSPLGRAQFTLAARRFGRGDLEPGLDRVVVRQGNDTLHFRLSLVATFVPSRDFALVEARVLSPRPPPPVLDWTQLRSQFGLSARECEVIAGVYQGKSNKQIAWDLGIEEATVKRHSHNIYEKTGLGSRVELVLGLDRPDPSVPSLTQSPKS